MRIAAEARFSRPYKIAADYDERVKSSRDWHKSDRLRTAHFRLIFKAYASPRTRAKHGATQQASGRSRAAGYFSPIFINTIRKKENQQ
jgi:hypothetical protein